MASLVVDTHALVWYLLGSPRLSATARGQMDRVLDAGESLYVPAVSLVELTYLVEKGRLPAIARTRLAELLDDFESGLVLAPLDRGTADAVERIGRENVPDMPDRIIAATALHLHLPLVTRDRKIRAADLETIW
jgi:PIN domain nuclease of toxin-antitoxin system